MYVRDGHGLMTTVEFPCNPLRTRSHHMTPTGGGIPMHMPLLCAPRQRHVGYVRHVMLAQKLSRFFRSSVLPFLRHGFTGEQRE